MEKMFKEDVAAEALAEAIARDPEDSYSIRQITGRRRTGPDGTGFDATITNPAEFKQALLDISRSWTSIRNLKWETDSLPLLTEIIEHVESLGTLDSLSIYVASCEERYFLPEDLSLYQRSKICSESPRA